MNLFNNSVILSFEVFHVDFKKKETVFVPGRAFHSLTFRTSGKINIEKDGNVLKSSPHTITYVPKGHHYNTEVTESGSMIAIHFNMAEDEKSNGEIRVITPENLFVMENLFSALLNNYTPGMKANFASFSILYEILAILSREKDVLSFIPEKIQTAKEFIDNRFNDSSLSVELVADAIKISEVYLRREFKSTFGISPLSYINSLRFENAKAMLKTGYYSVSEIAEKCGFSSLSYFSSSFHKFCGMSPSEYISRHL